eukprot:1182808-Prorocentrum_minimum.AAC.1
MNKNGIQSASKLRHKFNSPTNSLRTPYARVEPCYASIAASTRPPAKSTPTASPSPIFAPTTIQPLDQPAASPASAPAAWLGLDTDTRSGHSPWVDEGVPAVCVDDVLQT